MHIYVDYVRTSTVETTKHLLDLLSMFKNINSKSIAPTANHAMEPPSV